MSSMCPIFVDNLQYDWCYEIDSVPGLSYLLQTGQAIDESQAFLLLISARSVESRQVTQEVIRAHENGKLCIPVLRDISHAEFVSRQPEWRVALGGATSIRILANNASDVIPRIVEGLAASGIRPTARTDPSHIEHVAKALELRQGKAHKG